MSGNRGAIRRGAGLLIFIMAGWLGGSAVAADTILINDQFLDGSLANGSDAGETDTAWWAKKASEAATTWGVSSAVNYTIESGNYAINNGGSAPNTMLYGGFATTTLAVGQTIKFEFDMRRFAVDTTTAYTQLSMGYDGGTPMTADIVGNVAPLTDDKMIVTAPPMYDSTYITDTTPHHFVYQLTRRADGDYDRLVTLGGLTAYYDTVAATANPTYQFNQVAFAMPVGTSMRAIVDNIQVSLSPMPRRGLLREYWTNITGTAVSDLTNNTAYPNSPSGTDLLPSAEAVGWAGSTATGSYTNYGDNYGQRLRGCLIPPTDGDYTFWICSDNQSELWLNPDGPTASGAVRIAYENGQLAARTWQNGTGCSTNSFGTITLAAGARYYIEVRHKEGSGDDNLAVAWSGPGISRQIIPGGYLEPGIGSPPLPLWYDLERFQTHIRFSTGGAASATISGVSDPLSAFWNAAAHYARMGHGAFTRHVKTADGGATWPSAVGAIQPAVATYGDIASNLVARAHADGLRFIAYNWVMSDAWVLTNTDWECLDKNGQPIVQSRGTYISWCSPYLDYLRTRQLELVRRGVDGFYYDEIHYPPGDVSAGATNEYFAQTGQDLLSASAEQAEDFRQDVLERGFTKLVGAVTAQNPDAVSIVSGNKVRLGLMRNFSAVKSESGFWRSTKNTSLKSLEMGVTTLRDAAEGRPPHFWIYYSTDRTFAMTARYLTYGAVYNLDIAENVIQTTPFLADDVETNTAMLMARFELGRRVAPYLAGTKPLNWVMVHVDEKTTLAVDPFSQASYDAFQSLCYSNIPAGVILDWQIARGIPPECGVIVLPQTQDASARTGLWVSTLDAFTARGGLVLYAGDLTSGWVGQKVMPRHPPVYAINAVTNLDIVAYKSRDPAASNRLAVALAKGPVGNPTNEPPADPVAEFDLFVTNTFSTAYVYDAVSGSNLTAIPVTGGYQIHVPAFTNMALIVCDATPIPSSESYLRTVVDSTNALITCSGTTATYSDINDYGGSTLWLTSAGSSAQLTFDGTYVLVAVRATNNKGQVNIEIDGVPQASNLETYNSMGLYQYPVFVKADLPPGSHTIKVIASGTKTSVSSGTAVALDYIAFESSNGSHRPVLAAIGSQTVNKNSPLTFTASAADADVPKQTLTYSLTDAPASATINANTGVFTWTPDEAQEPGAYPVTVRVTDDGTPPQFDEKAVTVTVKPPGSGFLFMLSKVNGPTGAGMN